MKGNDSLNWKEIIQGIQARLRELYLYLFSTMHYNFLIRWKPWMFIRLTGTILIDSINNN